MIGFTSANKTITQPNFPAKFVILHKAQTFYWEHSIQKFHSAAPYPHLQQRQINIATRYFYSIRKYIIIFHIL